MKNYELENNEVILFEDIVSCKSYKGSLQLTLTSKKIVFEREKGLFKKEIELVDIIEIDKIKIYNDKPQVKQKGTEVNIQTIQNNYIILFSGIFKATKFVNSIIDTITGTTFTKRSTDKVKGAFDTVDDVLGISTRDTIKGVVENGITGTLLKGIKKKK